MISQLAAARAVADSIAERLASPEDVQARCGAEAWWPQSLAHGAAGIALLHIVRARAGLGPWSWAHDWLACAASGGVVSGLGSHLHYGAPALALALQAAADRPKRYVSALDELDGHVAASTRHRLQLARARIQCGVLPALAEFDAIRGLSGIGAYLLRSARHEDLLRSILRYLVLLTRPTKDGDDLVPGWWSAEDPGGQRSDRFPGGHANNGMAHGVGGPLALLSLATIRSVMVDGQAEAIGRICAWLDRWRQEDEGRTWWPYWITRHQLRDGPANLSGPFRPSWCYGTAGLARAQQLAALALGDIERQRMAEHAFVGAITDPAQLSAVTDLSLCHGYAGLLHIVRCVETSTATSSLAGRASDLLAVILSKSADLGCLTASPSGNWSCSPGLLEGAAGTALALVAACEGESSSSGWDSWLLVN